MVAPWWWWVMSMGCPRRDRTAPLTCLRRATEGLLQGLLDARRGSFDLGLGLGDLLAAPAAVFCLRLLGPLLRLLHLLLGLPRPLHGLLPSAAVPGGPTARPRERAAERGGRARRAAPRRSRACFAAARRSPASRRRLRRAGSAGAARGIVAVATATQPAATPAATQPATTFVASAPPERADRRLGAAGRRAIPDARRGLCGAFGEPPRSACRRARPAGPPGCPRGGERRRWRGMPGTRRDAARAASGGAPRSPSRATARATCWRLRRSARPRSRPRARGRAGGGRCRRACAPGAR